jgi:hypothetical protein
MIAVAAGSMFTREYTALERREAELSLRISTVIAIRIRPRKGRKTTKKSLIKARSNRCGDGIALFPPFFSYLPPCFSQWF